MPGQSQKRERRQSVRSSRGKRGEICKIEFLGGEIWENPQWWVVDVMHRFVNAGRKSRWLTISRRKGTSAVPCLRLFLERAFDDAVMLDPDR